MRPPDGEEVRRAAARDEDHVVRERQRPQIGRRPRIERQVRHVRIELVAFEPGARGVVEEHLAASGEPEDDLELRGARIAAERDDLPRVHPQIYD